MSPMENFGWILMVLATLAVIIGIPLNDWLNERRKRKEWERYHK